MDKTWQNFCLRKDRVVSSRILGCLLLIAALLFPLSALTLTDHSSRLSTPDQNILVRISSTNFLPSSNLPPDDSSNPLELGVQSIYSAETPPVCSAALYEPTKWPYHRRPQHDHRRSSSMNTGGRLSWPKVASVTRDCALLKSPGQCSSRWRVGYASAHFQ